MTQSVRVTRAFMEHNYTPEVLSDSVALICAFTDIVGSMKGHSVIVVGFNYIASEMAYDVSYERTY